MTTETATACCLYSNLATDPDLADLVAMFVEEVPDRLATMARQLDAADWQGLGRAAHQLKGAAGSYGFGRLTPALQRLENAALRDPKHDQAPLLFDRVVELCGLIRAGQPEPSA